MTDAQIRTELARLEAAERKVKEAKAELAPDAARFRREDQEAKALRQGWEKHMAEIQAEAHTKFDEVMAVFAAWAPPREILADARTAIAELRAAVMRTPCPEAERPYLSAAVENIVNAHPFAPFMGFLSKFEALPKTEQPTPDAGPTKEVA